MIRMNRRVRTSQAKNLLLFWDIFFTFQVLFPCKNTCYFLFSWRFTHFAAWSMLFFCWHKKPLVPLLPLQLQHRRVYWCHLLITTSSENVRVNAPFINPTFSSTENNSPPSPEILVRLFFFFLKQSFQLKMTALIKMATGELLSRSYTFDSLFFFLFPGLFSLTALS